ncbi:MULTISPECIES: transporter substrate-binding domain-containing protein [unclassified Rhizobium]|uniref:transporter substrate-binding domain-containing protein n=1 Tax=unclassified Rhizobium TaxID=2613769 RepID=UPI00161E7A0F|nr:MULTISPECIES: transporter substrate-binding domain-containing protein [unclassified Rhizobium]MBB3386233.1 octopine/nopaline transport system substrate-binding protein [Rhizobium sp. BK098]MBB3571753.1 octopine/nopaline transport system substrate-binding protein [Rhizobium sp. BK491]MBB3617937.1 octopine/nopaline transport system substrate-binding protein [Rhizobium sp. BK609]MBB3683610.1 octopine/nopaline transport system substrate-binding protein [Rhizobium sp. BK612]
MKRTVTLALSSLLLLAINSNAMDRKTITIASEGASPPWNAISAEGKLFGFDVEVGRELCRRMHVECTFVPQDWDGIIPALTVGKFDAIMSGMAITEKRKKSIAFSQPYAGGFNQLVVRKDLRLPPTDTSEKLNLTAIDAGKQAVIDQLRTALTGKTLGVLRSSNSEAVLNDLFGKVATIRSYDSQDNMHLDLVAERIDGGLADYFTWKAFLGSKDGGTATLYGPQLSGGLWGPGVGVGLRKDDQELITAFDNAIEAATRDGTLKRLSEQWFKIDVSPQASN